MSSSKRRKEKKKKRNDVKGWDVPKEGSLLPHAPQSKKRNNNKRNENKSNTTYTNFFTIFL